MTENIEKLKGKRILIFQQRGWAVTVGRLLAKNFYEAGAIMAAVTLKKSTHNWIIKQTEVKYERVVNIDEILEGPDKILAGENITLSEICENLNIGSVWPMLYSNRKLVRSYKDKFFYSYRQNLPDEYIEKYIKAYYKSLRDLFNYFKPDLVIISTFISDEHVMLKLFANKYNIPILGITDAKVPGYYVFCQDEFYNSGPLIDRCNELQAGKTNSENSEKARQFIAEFRGKFKKPIYANEERKENWLEKIRHELRPLREIYDWYTKAWARENYVKNVGPSVDYRPPRIILRDHFYYKKYKKFADSYDYYPLEKLDKFVFYPLKYTPEGNVDLMCPQYNNQIELARQIAMSLPDDYTLVAREHPTMVGYRNPSYLEKLARTPNVKLIDYRIPIEDIIKKTDLIINTFSTTFFEAAIYCKPVIMLMDSGIFKLLPNVFRHTDLISLNEKIIEVLKINLKTEAYDKQLINFITAVFDVGFDYNYLAAWEKGIGSKEKLWEIYKNEIFRLLK